MKPNWKTINGIKVDLNRNTIKQIESVERTANNSDATDKSLDSAYKKAKKLYNALGVELKTAHELADTDEIKVLRQRLDKAMQQMRKRYNNSEW